MKSITEDQVGDLQEEGVAMVVTEAMAEAMAEVEGEEGVDKEAIEDIQMLDG